MEKDVVCEEVSWRQGARTQGEGMKLVASGSVHRDQAKATEPTGDSCENRCLKFTLPHPIPALVSSLAVNLEKHLDTKTLGVVKIQIKQENCLEKNSIMHVETILMC